MSARRRVFLEAAGLVRGLVAEPEVGSRWGEPSALPRWSVGGLTGHLARGVRVVETYLDAPVPDTQHLLSPSDYWKRLRDDDLDSPANVAIRGRGEEEATVGQTQLIAGLDALIPRLRARLGNEPEDRAVTVIGGLGMLLDDYLATRLVEIVVHLDDLAVSVGLPTPVSNAALDVVIVSLIALAREQHGGLALMRALTRRERQSVEILRAF